MSSVRSTTRGGEKGVFVALCLVLAFRPWFGESTYGSLARTLIQIETILIVLVLFAFAFVVFVGKRKPIRLAPADEILLLLLLTSTVVSFLANVSPFALTDLHHLTKPVFIGLILLVVLNTDFPGRSVWFLRFIIGFALLQSVIACLQYLDIEFIYGLGALYDTGKMMRVRSVGTLGNPNFLAFFLLIGAVAPILLRVGWIKTALISGSLCFGIVLTGSVLFTGIAVPIIFLAIAARNEVPAVTAILASIFLISIGILIFPYVAAALASFSPRLAGFQVLLDEGGASAIRSLVVLGTFQQRLDHWADLHRIYTEGGVDAWKLLFGVSPAARSGIGMTDNEFLFNFYRMGLVGTVLFFGFFARVAVVLVQHRREPAAQMGLLVVITLLIASFFYETFSNPRLTYVLFVVYGLAAASHRVRRSNGGRVGGKYIREA